MSATIGSLARRTLIPLITTVVPFESPVAAQLWDHSMQVGAIALEHRRHRRQPGQTGTAAERQQQRLDLVVGMLAQQHRLQAGIAGSPRERLVARLPRGVLGAFPRRVARMHAAHLQRHAKGRANAAAVLGECVRRVLQPVVDVDRLHLSGPALHGGQQEHGGIGAAAVRDGQGQRQLQPGERGGRRVAVRQIRPWCR